MANVQKFPVYYVGDDPEEAIEGFAFQDYDAAIDYILDQGGNHKSKIWSALATVDFDTLKGENSDAQL